MLVSEKSCSLSYLNVNSMLKFRFDKLVTSHGQVKHLTDRMIQKFLYPIGKGERDKIILNFADMYNSNNNAGFNLTNFKVKFINQFFQDVVTDYEKSIIGTFTSDLIETMNQDEDYKENMELYFTITKFDNDYGYSLIH
jgi:hypothetical protein